jgi:hypothetical protein
MVTDTTDLIDIDKPTGIRPIECTHWCKDGDGHVTADCREAQACCSPDAYVMCSLEYVEISRRGGAFESQIGTMAYRGFNQLPVVLLHVYGFQPDIDSGINLTAAEARELADNLMTAAELIEIGSAK